MLLNRDTWRWTLGLIYIIAVATIWIVASYIVQSVVDSGVSPFLITYVCNSLFVVLIPIAEISRYCEDSLKDCWHLFRSTKDLNRNQSDNSENVNLVAHTYHDTGPSVGVSHSCKDKVSCSDSELQDSYNILSTGGDQEQYLSTDDYGKQVVTKERWTRSRVAKVSLLICPFWFFAQLTFNLSLKYTSVTSNTILSSTSSLFTFLVAVAFLGEKFTWVKLISVLLCMGGTVIVSLSDSSSDANEIATNPLLGDILAVVSAGLYAIYITLIRKRLPNDEKEGHASTAQFLGFLGLFNMLIFLPFVLVLNFTKLEPIHKLSWEQLGLIIGKGLLDNVLSDYLWAEAVHLTTTTVATAGLTIQVPIAAVVDSLTGHAPHLMDYIGAIAVMIGFAGINVPSDDSNTEVVQTEQEATGMATTSDRLSTDQSMHL